MAQSSSGIRGVPPFRQNYTIDPPSRGKTGVACFNWRRQLEKTSTSIALLILQIGK